MVVRHAGTHTVSVNRTPGLSCGYCHLPAAYKHLPFQMTARGGGFDLTVIRRASRDGRHPHTNVSYTQVLSANFFSLNFFFSLSCIHSPTLVLADTSANYKLECCFQLQSNDGGNSIPNKKTTRIRSGKKITTSLYLGDDKIESQNTSDTLEQLSVSSLYGKKKKFFFKEKIIRRSPHYKKIQV